MPCFCLPWSTAALVVGFLEIVGHMAVVTLASARLSGKEDILNNLSLDKESLASAESELVVRWTLLMIISALGLLFAFALVIGVQTPLPSLLLVWLVSKVVLFLAFVLQWTLLPGERRYQHEYPTRKEMSRSRNSNGIQLVSQVIGLYCWYVVFTYWQQLKKLKSVGSTEELPSPNNSNC